MNEKSLPKIPLVEYKKRWQKIQKIMDKEDYDLILAYSNDRAVFGQAHARWIADFPTHLEPVCIIIFKNGDPIIISGPETKEYIRNRSKISEVYFIKEFTHPEEEYLTNIESFEDIVSNKLGSRKIKKVGIAGLDLIDINTWNAFQGFLSKVQWYSIEDKISEVRAQKSAAEIEVMRYAYNIASRAFNAAIEVIKSGVTEIDIAAEAEYVMRKSGADGTGIDTMVGSGPNSSLMITRATARYVKNNDIVRLTVVPKYEGYCASISRPVFVGEKDKKISKIFENICNARKACLEKIRAGELGSVVEGAGRSVLKEAGFNYSYSGVHNIGVKEFESPIYGPNTKGELKAGMVISIEVPLFEQAWGGLHTEDGCLVKSNGKEMLHDTPLYINK